MNARCRLRIQFVTGVLTLGIVEIEFFGKRCDRLHVLCREQCKRRMSVAHSARGIDTGRNGKGKRLRRHLVRLAEKRRKCGARMRLDPTQSLRHNVTVFPQKRHTVRHCGERRKVNELGCAFPKQRCSELERHPCAA